MVAGDIRRSARNIQLKPLEHFVTICNSADNSRNACLIALLYLSGRRINEVLHLRKLDLRIKDGFMSFETFNEKCFRREKAGSYSIFRKDRFYEKIECIFSMESEAFKVLGSFIKDHLENLNEDDYVFESFRGSSHIKSSMAHRIVTKLDPNAWPHWIRHQRLTFITEQLKKEHMNDMELLDHLRDFAKHHRVDSTLSYVHQARRRKVLKMI